MKRTRRAARHMQWVMASCLIALVWLWSATATYAAASPQLTLDPDRGPCAMLNPPITVHGSGFPAGMTVDVTERRASAPPNQPRGTVGHATVRADGTFSVSGMLGGCAPPIPDGAQFVIEVVDPTPPPGGGYLTVLASATFTKEAATPTTPGLPNTGSGGMAPITLSFNSLVFASLLGLLGSTIGGILLRRRYQR